MKILIVLPYFKAGGTERQASYIANHFVKQGHTVTTLSIANEGEFKSLFNGRVESLYSNFSNKYFFINLLKLVKFVSSNNYDVIISRAWNTNILCGITSQITKVQSVLFLSGSIDLSGHSIFKKLVTRFAFNGSKKVISVSNESKINCQKFLNVSDSKINVVHNGVDIDWVTKQSEVANRLLVSEEAHPNIVFVGSLNHRKGIDILLEAFRIVSKEKIATLHLIGSGDERKYKKLAKELNINNKVIFWGEKKNPFPYLAKASVFVLSSRAEGFPNVLLEAMALSKPVISADCDTGPREILDGRNGLLFHVENEVDLANKMLTLLNNKDLSEEMGYRAKKTVETKFQLQDQLKKIENIVLSLKSI